MADIIQQWPSMQATAACTSSTTPKRRKGAPARAATASMAVMPGSGTRSSALLRVNRSSRKYMTACGAAIRMRCVDKLRAVCRSEVAEERLLVEGLEEHPPLDTAEVEGPWWATSPEAGADYAARADLR